MVAKGTPQKGLKRGASSDNKVQGTPQKARKVAKGLPQTAASAVTTAASAADESMNMEMIKKVSEALDVINNHKVFKHIMQEKPLDISTGGAQASFNHKSLSTVLQGNANQKRPGHYICGGNFWWQNFIWLANSRTPINPGMVSELQRFSLKPLDPPRNLPFRTVIGLEVSADKKNAKDPSAKEPAEAASAAGGNDNEPDEPFLIVKRCIATPFTT